MIFKNVSNIIIRNKIFAKHILYTFHYGLKDLNDIKLCEEKLIGSH